jgi:hypothetical protein
MRRAHWKKVAAELKESYTTQVELVKTMYQQFTGQDQNCEGSLRDLTVHS